MIALVAAAWAQEEACTGPYDRASFDRALDAAETAFVTGEGSRGQVLFEALRHDLRCLDAVPKVESMARMDALGALAGHVDQDSERALRWARAAEWVMARPPWPVPAEHPIRVELAASDPVRIDTVPGTFVLPKNGALWLSGRKLETPEIPVDVPVLLQVTDGDGAVVRTEWLDGAAFPPDLLSDGPPGKAPKGGGSPPKGGGKRIVGWAAGGAGRASQVVDEPGDFLASAGHGSAFGAVGATLRPGWVFADLRAQLPGSAGASEGWGGLALAAGPVDVLLGGGALAAPVFEGTERRRLLAFQPHLGVEVPVPLEALLLVPSVTGGGVPGALHARAGADLLGRPGWLVGLELGLARTGFVQPGSERDLAVTSTWVGLRAGFGLRS